MDSVIERAYCKIVKLYNIPLPAPELEKILSELCFEYDQREIRRERYPRAYR